MINSALKSAGFAMAASAIVVAAAYAQAPVAGGAAPARAGQAPAGQAPAGQAPAAGVPARGGGQSVGTVGDPDPAVRYIVVVDDPSVRVLQVTLQPGAVRRQHVHNDVTFHMLVPVTGSLEVTEGSLTDPSGKEVITTLPGQAYYMV